MPFLGVLEPSLSGFVAPVAPSVHALEGPSLVVVLVHVVGEVLHEIKRVIARNALETERWLVQQVEVDCHDDYRLLSADSTLNQTLKVPWFRRTIRLFLFLFSNNAMALWLLQYVFVVCRSQTIINDAWSDDWAVDVPSGISGWSINKQKDFACGPESRYHGVWGEVGDPGSITLSRSFTCDNGVPNQRYAVSIAYGFGYDPCADNEIRIAMNIDGNTEANYVRADGYTRSSNCFYECGCGSDSALIDVFDLQQHSIWPATLSNVASADPFMLAFDMQISYVYMFASHSFLYMCVML